MGDGSANKGNAKVNAAIFGGVALLWFLLDYATKRLVDASPVGSQIWEGIPGLLDFRLVHNTGAAWGIFGGSTFALGVFAVVFSILLLVIAHLRREKGSRIEMLGYGLVLAGGLGNAVDRFTSGYVVDFIEATFVDFPVFNIADIGVTCGFVIIIACCFLLGNSSGEGE